MEFHDGVVWGKWLKERGPYPLLAHLLDTAAYGLVLQESGWVSVPMRQRLAELGLDPVALAFTCGIHDCGKADPWFIAQENSQRRQEFLTNMDALAANRDLPRPDNAKLQILRMRAGDSLVRRSLRHEAMSGHVANRHGFPDWLAAVIAGHHGRYQAALGRLQRAAAARHRTWLDGTNWAREQGDLIDCLHEALPSAPTLPPTVPAELIPVLTGLVNLADWCASDQAFLAWDLLPLLSSDPGQYLKAQMQRAAKLVPNTIGLPVRPTGKFAELFGFPPSKPIQDWVVARGENGPALRIFVVPTAEGKTEAGLWLHCCSTDHDGLLFALPTMATTDAMFTRVRELYRGTPALGALRHSMATLNSFYQPSSASPTSVCDDEGGLSGSDWLNGRHRALLAPVTVCTCDQVLAAAVDHKHIPARMVALANKHLILDEVHAYDAYQDTLLTRLLGWLGRIGTRVTILTATLPTRRIQSYIQAYSGNTVQLPETHYPAAIVAPPGGPPTCHRLGTSRTYRHNLARADLDSIPNDRSYQLRYAEQTAELVLGLREQTPNQRIAVIVNTVERAILIASILDKAEHADEMLLLHSRMTAAQRNDASTHLLDRAGKLAPHGRALTLVATQVAEASLDFDVDTLLTDIAPMPSLLQRMGRQWRHSSCSESGWQHPVGALRHGQSPLVRIMIPRDERGGLHPKANPPYTRAEMTRTLNALTGLDGIEVPGDVQALVDTADVSMADLVATGEDELSDVLEHLGRASDAATAANEVGTDVDLLIAEWECHPAWDQTPILAKLTEPQLWREDAVTRLRDRESDQLLILDPDGETQYCWPGTAQDVMNQVLDGQTVTQILGSTIQVSGGIALATGSLPFPQGWQQQSTAVLRPYRPLTTTQLETLDLQLHPRFGLMRTTST